MRADFVILPIGYYSFPAIYAQSYLQTKFVHLNWNIHAYGFNYDGRFNNNRSLHILEFDVNTGLVKHNNKYTSEYFDD